MSISNLFTGDAPDAVLTMSRRSRNGETTRRAVAWFVSNPNGLVRSLSRSVSELVRDRFQARRAIRRDVRPRCERTWSTALLRCVTNGALRDLNTVLVAQHMLRGTRSVYVDYVDYDEIAHHAGVLRPESLEALESIDGVLRQLELVATVAPRPYRFVVLSDHGQAQGATFADRYPEDLATLVSRLARADVAGSTEDVEGWGRARVLVDELATGSGVSGKTMQSASNAMDKRDRNAPEQVDDSGPRKPQSRTDGSEGGRPDLPRLRLGQPGTDLRSRREATTVSSPARREVPGSDRGSRGPPRRGICRGDRRRRRRPDRARQRRLAPAQGRAVEGVDPLLPFGPLAPEFVLRVALRPEAPDIYVNSLLDPGTDEVAAFEGLVGCHGGLGGWQDRAFVAVPSDLPFPVDRVIGADALHVALRDILRHLGHRRDLAGLDAQGNGAETPTLASTPTDRTG